MKDLAGRRLLIAIAAALMILMIPAMMAAMGVRVPGLEEAYAGGDVDLNSVTIAHSNADGTIYNGEEIYVGANNLAAVYGMTENEFTGLVKNGKIGVSFSVSFYNDSDIWMMDPIEITKDKDGHSVYHQDLETTFSTGAYRAVVSPKYYPHDGVFAAVQLFTSGESDEEGYGSHYNNNSKQYKIVDRFETKAQINPTYYQSCSVNKATLVFKLDQLGKYKAYGFSENFTSYNTVFRYFNSKGKEIAHFEMTGTDNLEMKIPISYGKNKITLGIYSIVADREYFANSYILELDSAKLGKNTVRATKINKNKAIVRWNGVSGAQGYYVYQGSKKIKTLKKSARKLVVSRKKAGTSKFKVIPYVKVGGVKKGTSNKVKPKANFFKTGKSTYYKSYGYAKGDFILTKASANGKKYTFTCYAINNRIFRLEKYKKITIKVWADGKLLVKKTLKNKKVNVKESASKRVVIKAKGKIGDLRNGKNVTYSISYSPLWEHGMKAW